MTKTRIVALIVVMVGLASGCGGKKAVAQRSAQSYYDEAKHELERRHYLKAGELFQKVVVNFPGSNLVDDAQFGVAEAKFGAKEFTEAIFEYQRLIDDYPSSPFAETGHYKVALCYAAQSNNVYLDQSDTKRAISELQRFADDYPDSKLTQEARKKLTDLKGKLAAKEAHIADNYLKWGHAESAQIYYQRVLEMYGDTPWVDEARLGMALAKARKGEVDAALADLHQILASNVSQPIKKRAQDQIDDLRKKHTAPRKEIGSESGSADRPSGGSIRPGP